MIDKSLLEGRHRAVTDAVRWLDSSHLPPYLQRIAQPFEAAIAEMLHNVKVDDPQITHAINRTIEAKDCAVRAAVLAYEAASSPQR
jgi:hypothetical protein